MLFLLVVLTSSKLLFDDEFNKFDFSKWKHDITLSGGGNWEFELYENNRSTSFVKDGMLNIKPVLTEDKIGAEHVRNGYDYNIWGGTPADRCTMNAFYGCERASNGNNYINPVMSAKINASTHATTLIGLVKSQFKGILLV